MSENIFVGLDMSLTATGFAIVQGNSLSFKTIKTKPDDFKNDLERLNYIIKTTVDSIPKDVTMIVIEDIYMSAFQSGSSLKLTGLAFLMRKSLYDLGYSFFIPTANQCKKFLSGKGSLPKDQVTKEVFRRWGEKANAKNDNEADSINMAYLSQSLYNYVTKQDLNELTKPMAEVIKSITYERPSYNIDFEKYGLKVKKDEKE